MKFLNELGNEYRMSKTAHKEKEQGYGICAIFRDALSHMGEATVYWAAAEAQSWLKNDFGRRVDALVTGHRTKYVGAKHQFTP